MSWLLLRRLTAHQAIWGGEPPPVTDNVLYWSVDDLNWSAGNNLIWGQA